MSRDLLIEKPHQPATESPTHDEPRAAELVEDLLASVEREWSAARPRTESLWQLAGE